jgi:hypothetical protein
MTLTEQDLSPILNRIPPKWGKEIRVDAGWYAIVLELDRQLAIIDPAYEVYQCKEKFGGLRYYCSIAERPEAEKLIEAAEAKSFATCEICGQPGKTANTKRSWIRTLCGSCRL